MHWNPSIIAAAQHRVAFVAIGCSTLLSTALVLAEDQGAAGAGAASDETVYSLLMKGGTLMYPIFLCSIVLVTVAIERAISMRRKRVGSSKLLDRVIECVPSREKATAENLDAAAESTATDSALLGALLQHGLMRLHRDEAHVQLALEEAATKEMHRLQRRLRPFAVIATLAPLLGLLGTVFGMILCFGEASTAEATERAQKLADGIYRALVTTAAGLSVAIPSMLLNHFYQGRVDSIIDLFDETATQFLDHYYGGRNLPRSEAVKVGEQTSGVERPRSAASAGT